MSEKDRLSQKDNSNNLTRYQTLLLHRQHAERIFWSRIQTLHAIQAGILAGGFLLITKGYFNIATTTFSLGALLTIVLGYLAYNDWSDAKVNQDCMHQIGDSLGIRRTSERNHIRKILKSHRVLFGVILAFIIGDIVLAIWGKCLLP